MKPSRKRSLRTIVLVIAGVAIVVAVLSADRGSILARSRRVSTAIDWRAVQWLDGHTLIYAGPTVKGVVKLNTFDASQGSRTFFELHLAPQYYTPDTPTTGNPANPLAQLYSPPKGKQVPYPGKLVFGDDNGRTSPDGKWTIWDADHSYEIVSTAGATHFRVANPMSRAEHPFDTNPYVYRSGVVWTYNGDRWVEIRPDSKFVPHLYLHELTGKIVSQTVLGPPKPQDFQGDNTPVGPMIVGVTPSNHVVLWDLGSTLIDADLNASPIIVRRYAVKVPSEGTLLDVVLSPDGKTLLWRTHLRSRFTWAASTLKRLHLHIPFGTHILWLSDAHGSHMRELARESADEPEIMSYDNSDYTFYSFRWTPNSRNISFIYDNSIWVMPVDGN